jgi:hypothetical protein
MDTHAVPKQDPKEPWRTSIDKVINVSKRYSAVSIIADVNENRITGKSKDAWKFLTIFDKVINVLNQCS